MGGQLDQLFQMQPYVEWMVGFIRYLLVRMNTTTNLIIFVILQVHLKSIDIATTVV